MVTMLGSRRERAKVTWQQRLAGVVIAIFLVIQVPIYRFDVEYDDGSLRQLHLGPLETTCLGYVPRGKGLGEGAGYTSRGTHAA